MFTPFIFEDGTFIYNEYELFEYLSSLGLNPKDLKNFFQQEIKDSYSHLQKISDSFEREADGCFCNLRDMSEEIEELCNKLRVGKGGTKKEIADKIMSVVNYYRV